MINLAMLKNNKWIMIGLVLILMILIYLIIGKVDNLLHPNLDKQMARQHVADKVIINEVVKKNKELHEIVVKDKKASELTIGVTNKYTDEKVKKDSKVDKKTSDLNMKQKILENKSNVRDLPLGNDKRTLAQKILDDNDYQRRLEIESAKVNISAIYAVYAIVKE